MLSSRSGRNHQIQYVWMDRVGIHLLLIRSYVSRGHLAAQIDPLGLNNMDREQAKKMIIRSVTVAKEDLDTVFQLPQTTFIEGKEKSLTLREIINRLENVYCRSIGAEFLHINNLDQVNWIR